MHISEERLNLGYFDLGLIKSDSGSDITLILASAYLYVEKISITVTGVFHGVSSVNLVHSHNDPLLFRTRSSQRYLFKSFGLSECCSLSFCDYTRRLASFLPGMQ